MKILFLDIDGVLNSDVYMASDEYFNACKEAGIQNHRSYEVVTKAHHLHIDPAGVKILNDLIAKSGVKVVLSSTWRIRYSLEEMNEMLKSRGATFEVTDKTPAKMSFRMRGSDIAEYLRDLEEEEGIVPEAFVILDDRDEFAKLQDHFVLTPEATGITQEHVTKALKILGVE
jgi:hypothetical protein